ncbi:MAG: hypothetical protein R3351_09685, partial [Nitrospirales bacterium]|nr:hypothetical protein [Nitrospirales bacterium]
MRTPNQGISNTCRYRSAMVCLAFLVGFAIIFVRLFFLQVIEAEEGADQARKQHYTSMMLQANRGVIVDRNGKPLALNVDLPSVYAIPQRVQKHAMVANKLSRLL